MPEPREIPPLDVAAAERFWAKVEITDACWLWTGCLDHNGYGSFSYQRRSLRAHRVAYSHVRGGIPDGLVLDHLCRVHRCVRPDHLEPVTVRVNNLRGIGFAAVNAAKTSCPRGHMLSVENVVRHRDGRRSCRICLTVYHREYQRKAYRTDREAGAERARDYRQRNRELVNARARERRARLRAERLAGGRGASSAAGDGTLSDDAA